LLFLRKETRELVDSDNCGVLKEKLLLYSCCIVVVVVVVAAAAVIVVQNTKLRNENFHNHYS
jgi:hypothetical protein